MEIRVFDRTIIHRPFVFHEENIQHPESVFFTAECIISQDGTLEQRIGKGGEIVFFF